MFCRSGKRLLEINVLARSIDGSIGLVRLYNPFLVLMVLLNVSPGTARSGQCRSGGSDFFCDFLARAVFRGGSRDGRKERGRTTIVMVSCMEAFPLHLEPKG